MVKPVPDEGNFYEITKEAISKNRHENFVKNTIKEYEDYKNYFSNVFTNKPLGNIYKFRVKYLLKNAVWRDIIIFQDQTLDDLADEIIFSMNWDNDHMHGFGFPFKRGKQTEWDVSPYTIYAPDWEDDPIPTYKSNQIKIGEVDFVKFPKLRFTFDYGENHEFDVLYKGVLELSEESHFKDLPITIDQRGVAPEQYPSNEDWFHDDCDTCKKLKESGIEMQWHIDEPLEKKKVVN